MAVHISLSKDAMEESDARMLPTRNLLKPADGSPISVPNKEMVLGCYYLTTFEQDGDDVKEEELPRFADAQDAIFANQSGQVRVRQRIRVRLDGAFVTTSVGRIMFNEILPENFPFVNEETKAATIKELVSRALKENTNEEVVELIDAIKDLGFKGATLSGGVSVSVFDCEIIDEKGQIVQETEEKVAGVVDNYQQGLITDNERQRLSNDIWIDVTEKIADMTWQKLSDANPV